MAGSKKAKPATVAPCELCSKQQFSYIDNQPGSPPKTNHKHISVGFPNGVRLVFPGRESSFLCRCGSVLSKAFLKGRHSLQCDVCIEKAGIKLFNMTKSATAAALSSNEFIQPPVLANIHLSIHKQTGYIMCTKCRCGVWPTALEHHCARSLKHTDGYTGDQKEKNRANVVLAIQYLNGCIDPLYMSHKQIELWLQTLQPGTHPPIPGIDVARGSYFCIACHCAFLSRSSFQKHWEYEHPCLENRSCRYTRGSTQTLYSSNYINSNIKVVPMSEIYVDIGPVGHKTCKPVISIDGKPWSVDIGFDTIRDEDSFDVMSKTVLRWSDTTELWERALCNVIRLAIITLNGVEPSTRQYFHLDLLEKSAKDRAGCCYQLVHTLTRLSTSYEMVEQLMLTPAQYDAAKKLCAYLDKRALDILYSKSYAQVALQMLWDLQRELWMVHRNFGHGYAHYYSVFRYLCYISWDEESSRFRDSSKILESAESLVFWARASICVAFEEESGNVRYPLISVRPTIGNGFMYTSKEHHLAIYEAFLEGDNRTPFSAIAKVIKRLG